MLTYKHSNKKNDLEEYIHQNNFFVQSTFLIGYTRLLRTLRGFLNFTGSEKSKTTACIKMQIMTLYQVSLDLCVFILYVTSPLTY